MKKIFKRIAITMIGIFVFISLVSAMVIKDNYSVNTKNYSIYSKKLHPVFNDYKIAVISDFHNSNNYNKIIENTIAMKPNVILLSGDLISMNDTNFDNVSKLLAGITPIAPVYFSNGNHETWAAMQDEFLNFLSSNNVNVINNKAVQLEYKNKHINLVGYKDIVYADDVMRMPILNNDIAELYSKIENKNDFTILMFHRANYFDAVAKYPFDLVLSGHTHGGQIGIPYISKKITQYRICSDKYIKGYYRTDFSQMIVSGGLENNLKYLRILNTPEVICVTLKNL